MMFTVIPMYVLLLGDVDMPSIFKRFLLFSNAYKNNHN